MVLGYFYPDSYNTHIYLGSFAVQQSGRARYVEGIVEISEPDILKTPVKLLKLAVRMFRRLPGIGLLMSVGMQSWLWMLALAYLAWKKQYKFCIPMVLHAGTLITCFVSPIAGSARYVLSLFYCLPLMFAVCAQSASENTDKANEHNPIA